MERKEEMPMYCDLISSLLKCMGSGFQQLVKTFFGSILFEPDIECCIIENLHC